VDGAKIQKPRINMKNTVGKILLFILLKIASQQIIKVMDFMPTINLDKLQFGLIIEHIKIRPILI